MRLQSSLISKFSTYIHSNLVVWNNALSIKTEDQTMMVYMINPQVSMHHNMEGKLVTYTKSGKIGLHLVETRLQFVKSVDRLHFFLKLQGINQFINHKYKSTVPLSLAYKNRTTPSPQRNMDVRFREDLNTCMMTFFDLQNNSVSKIKRLAVQQPQMIVLKQITRQGLYDMAGLDLDYSLRYDEIVDEIVAGVESENLKKSNDEQILIRGSTRVDQQPSFSHMQDMEEYEEFLQNSFVL